MNRANTALLLRAARHIERDAAELRRSSVIPQSRPPKFPDPKDALHYKRWMRLAVRLRGLTLEEKP